MVTMSAIFALPATIMQDQAQAVADNLTQNMSQLAADRGVSSAAKALVSSPEARIALISITPISIAPVSIRGKR